MPLSKVSPSYYPIGLACYSLNRQQSQESSKNPHGLAHFWVISRIPNRFVLRTSSRFLRDCSGRQFRQNSGTADLPPQLRRGVFFGQSEAVNQGPQAVLRFIGVGLESSLGDSQTDGINEGKSWAYLRWSRYFLLDFLCS